MVNLLDESGCEKLVDLLTNDLTFLLVEATQPLFHWLGTSSNFQGVLGDFPRMPGMFEGVHANMSAFARRKSTSTASYLGSGSALVVSTMPPEPLVSSGIFFVPSAGSKLPA